MSIQEIQNNKEAYTALCRQYIKRDGLEKLLDYLEKTDYGVTINLLCIGTSVDQDIIF